MGERICSVDGCERPVLVERRRWCKLHYERWRKHGDVGPPGRMVDRPPAGSPPRDCLVDGCDHPRKSRGYCYRHYENLRKYDDPLSAADRTPMQRLEHIGWDVTETGCWEWRGNRNRGGYGRISVDHVHWLAPRLMLSLIDPRDNIDELVVRHRCDNPPCVRPEHIEWGSMLDNSADMVERARENSYRADWWGGTCKNGLHDITQPGALVETMNASGNVGHRCRECRELARAKEAADRRR